MTDSEQDMFPQLQPAQPGGLWSSTNVDPNYQRQKWIVPVRDPIDILFIKSKAGKFPKAASIKKPFHTPIKINLGLHDFMEVMEAAGKVIYHNMTVGAKDKYGCQNKPLSMVFAYCAEKAISNWTGLPWNNEVGKYEQPDVGEFIQVRSTDQEDTVHLITHEEDKDTDIFILVTNEKPLVNKIWGWIYCSETKDHEEFWCKLQVTRGAFGIPRGFLRSPESLLPILERGG